MDTNVLVRLFVPDAPAQTARALAFLKSRTAEDPAFVSIVALVELAWVLKRSYGFSAPAIHVALDSLLDSSNVRLERANLVSESADVAKAGNSDLADCIISALAAEAGATATVTFDRDAAKRVPGMEVLK